jgi:thiamine-phosphate pyrophosphorylase
MKAVRGLYAIVDGEALESCGLGLLEFAQAVLLARPAALQLRLKKATDLEIEERARQLASLARAAGVPFYLNDRPELALRSGCDGVHVGQKDMPIDQIRSFAPGLGVGLSNHTLPLLEASLATRPDYVAYGPVFATPSKADAEPVTGLDELAEAGRLAQRAGCPLVAIGGITLFNAHQIARWAEQGAVIGALLPKGTELSTVTEQARALHLALGGV